MKTTFPSIGRIAQALALAGLVSFVPAASAIEYWLRAEPLTVSMPGSVNVPMWGYALDGTSCTAVPPATCQATVPGPALTVPVGDTLLTIHLKNDLPASTSIVIPGQITNMVPVKFTDSTGRQRVRSFTHETLVGGIGDYSWTNMKPGTYLYHSGTHPQVQVQMGLYGGVKKDFASGVAYPGVTYSNEVALLYSEIDPALHATVAGGTYDPEVNSTLNYQPKYFLINGQAFVKPVTGDPPALATLTSGQPTLLRFLNAGLKTHVPVINGLSMRLVAEDGNPYPWPANPREQYSVLLPAAKTIDAIIVPQVATDTRYPIYDRMMGLSNGGMPDGGMLAFLNVSGGGGVAPAFTSTPVTAATQGVLYSYTLTATDVDGGTLSYSLDAKPAGMNVNASSGLITWTPGSAQLGPQAVTARVTDPTGLFATQPFSIVVADANDPPLAQNDAYTMIRGGTLNVAARGVVTNDSDPDIGDTSTLSAVSFTLPTPTPRGTLVGNANGGFSYTPPSTTFIGTRTFTYRAQDSSGATSNVATVSITVIANRAPVAVDDTLAAPVRRSSPPYVPVVINVLGNDSDPDTAIDPGNVINPATVTITTAPNKGASVVVNADGTLAYTPKLNFRGTETFRYRVRDSYVTPANSNAAYVRVNVQ